jgi:hypothetical protein
MAQRIGYQDGLAGFVSWVRKISLGTVKYRPVGDRPASLEQWHWLEKFERTIRILKDDHDAAVTTPQPPEGPPDPPDPPKPQVAPRTYNGLPGGEPSARFCTAGLPRNAKGRLYDVYSEYDDDGRDLGGRTNRQVDGLPPADAMDNYGPCDTREWMGRVFPPWPAESYER